MNFVKYKKLVISCIGDSLTEGDYGVYQKSGIANVKKENYPFFLAQILDAEVRNFGSCGYRATQILEKYKKKEIDVTNSDIIIIMLGTNGGNSAICETECNEDYREIIRIAQKQATNAKIVLCTPPHATKNPDKSNYGYYDNVKNAAEFVRKTAQNMNLYMIDVFNCKYFNEDTEDEMQPNDGLHFSEKGYKLLAEFIADELKRMFLDKNNMETDDFI